jgi:transcriptional regulator with XRE-family HTH domain
MSELGRLLREARTAKDLSLADVESVTRIRQKYLEALETGDFATLPRGAVARGFLRTYATFLGLDADEMLRRYGKESGDAGDEVAIAEPGKPRLVDYRPLEVTLSEPTPGSGWWPWVVAALVVIAAGALIWWLAGRNDLPKLLSAFGPAKVLAPSATPTQTATAWVVTATPKPMREVVLATPTSDLLPLPTPTVPVTLTPTPRPTETPEVIAQVIDMQMRITQRAWVRVTVDGEVVQEGTLESGAVKDYQAEQSISIRTGNGGGVSLTLNGEDLGPMGDVGKVVERTWVVDQGEITEQAPGTPAVKPLSQPTQTPTPAG